MIEKIDTSQFQEPLEKPTPKQSSSTGPVPEDNIDVSIQVNYASLIDQATQPLQTDAEVIEQARKLLKSDQLVSLERIQEAVENMVKFGI